MIPLRDSKRSGRFPLVTIALIAINFYVFYLELTSQNLDGFFAQYALIPSLIDTHNPATWYPFITSMFLHGGFFHILSNMLFLWIFGDNVEERFGMFYLPVYLLGGIMGGLAQYFLMPNADIPIVGASGGVATILGAYLIFYPGSRILTLLPIFFLFTIVEIPAFFVLAYWFFLQVFNGITAIGNTSASLGGVAYFAHIGGFISGVVYAYLLGRPEASRSQPI
jgi:membrane associated rhomboid family serine protease